MTTNNVKVWVFVHADVVVAPGHFDQWAAFADTETEARIKIQIRHGIPGEKLKLVDTIEDRRKASRFESDRRRSS